MPNHDVSSVAQDRHVAACEFLALRFQALLKLAPPENLLELQYATNLENAIRSNEEMAATFDARVEHAHRNLENERCSE